MINFDIDTKGIKNNIMQTGSNFLIIHIEY